MEHRRLLLLGYTNGASTTASCLGVLTTDTEAPVVSQTTMGTDLLQTLKILTELVVKGVGKNLRVLSIDNVLLSVEEPIRDFVLAWVGDDGDELLSLFLSQLSSTLVMSISAFLQQITAKRRPIPLMAV